MTTMARNEYYMTEKLKVLDLFSGLGGFSLGLERTGHFETVAFCDNDKYSKLIIDKHWKGKKVYEDVREITKEKLIADGIELPDVITGGFPCQPFSVAGKQKGTSDDRHLWPEMFRIIKALKPRIVVGENVRGIVNIQDGMVFETVCTTWKMKDTKSKRSIFQLQVSALPTEEKEFGSSQLWATPNTMDHLPTRSEEGTRKLMEGQRKGRTAPSNLREQVDEKTMQLWRTPTTMDSKEDSLKHATKLLQGKHLRATGSRIQITLADEVMVEEIKANPQLMEQYKDYEMLTRKNLPEQQKFVDYMREQTSVKELFEKTGITKTTIEHWFRRDKAGFSHPSVEDWEKIKPHLKEIKYDKELTTLHSIEWKQDPKSMWPTPTTKGFGHASEGQTMIMRKKVEAGELTEEEAQAMMNGTTLRPPRMKKWMWPTPNARDWKDSVNKVPPSVGKTRGHSLGMKVAEVRNQEMWPTPTANEDACGKPTGKMQKMLGNHPKVRGTGGGTLNPTWVEWLMGYEGGYTDLKDWEILSSHKSSKKSAKR